MNYLEIRAAAKSKHDISFSSKLDIFAHHFPTSPLLPGALSALLLSESCGGTGWSLKKIIGLRFRKPLTPELPVTVTYQVIQESTSEKKCSAKIQNGNDTIADGDFIFEQSELKVTHGSRPAPKSEFWNASRIRDYLPHGEPIVLIDQFVEAQYPKEIQAYLSGDTDGNVDQTKLLGTKVHTRSVLKPGNVWIDGNILPSSVLSELAAQAGALTLAPFFTGTKPQVSLLGCDTEYFALAEVGSTIDTFVELTRVKRLGKSANMIIFKCECFVGDTKIAQVNLNAMANF